MLGNKKRPVRPLGERGRTKDMYFISKDYTGI